MGLCAEDIRTKYGGQQDPHIFQVSILAILSPTQASESFLMQSAKAFQESGHVTEALMSCDLCGRRDDEHQVILDCVRVECLGTLGDDKGLLAFIAEVYV